MNRLLHIGCALGLITCIVFALAELILLYDQPKYAAYPIVALHLIYRVLPRLIAVAKR